MTGGLLLDLDGTLIDSEPLHRATYAAFFEARGWTDVDPSLFTGRRAADVFESTPGPWGDLDPERLAEEVVAFLPADGRPEAVAGAASAIEAASAAGLPVAVVTSAQPAWAELVLGVVLGVSDHVDVIVTGRDVLRGKPDPACYRLAAAQLILQPEDAVAVEDSPAGIAAALAAGVGRVVGISTTRSAEDLLAAGAQDVLPDLTGLADLLDLQPALDLQPGPGPH